MSRVNVFSRTVSMLALASLTGCAATPDPAPTAVADDAVLRAMEEATQPATADQIAAAERSDPLTRANFWSEEYRKDSASLGTTLAFMRALRGIGSHERAIEVASRALPVHPDSYELYLELGRAQLSEQKYPDAALAFVRAADLAPASEAAPLAALGVSFDRQEQHLKAQEAYQIALQREPDRVSTLSNYGLSLALTGDLEAAEAQLRKAVSLPGANVRVRQNLALVLGLQGRFDEMAEVDPNAPQRTVEANRAALRAMLVPQRNYSTLDEPTLAAPASEPMPSVNAATVTSEAMSVPVVADTPTATQVETKLAGGKDKPPALRPRLRGSQSE